MTWPMTRPMTRPGPLADPATARAAGLALALVLGFAGPAEAGNWSLAGGFSERLEADTNYRLSEDGEALWGSISSLNFDLGYDTKRTNWRLGSGFSLSAFAGPGDSGNLNGFSDPRITGAVVHSGKDQTIGANFGFLRRSTAFTLDEEDITLASGDATETAANLSGFWTQRLDAKNSVTLSTNGNIRRFSDDEGQLTPSTSYGVTGSWNRTLDRRTSAGASLGVRFSDQDGPDTDTESTIWRLGANLVRRLTPRHGFNLDLGISRAAVTETTDLGFFSIEDERNSLGFSGGAGFDWRGPGGTAVALTASQALESGADGGLDQTSRVAASLSRPLTRRSTAGLVADFTRRSAEDDADGGGASYFISAGPRLDFQLTRDWSAGLGLRLRRRDDDDGAAHSARVFFEVSRPLILNR